MKTKRITFVFALIFLCVSLASATTYTWTGKAPSPNNDLWSNPQNWSPSNSVPGAGDTAIIGNSSAGTGVGNVKVDSSVTVANLTLVSSTMNLTGTLTVSGTFESQYVSLYGSGNLVVNGAMNMDLVTYVDNATTLLCALTVNGSAMVNSNVTLFIGNNVTVVNNGSFTLANTATVNAVSVLGAAFVNQGTFSGGNASVTMGSCIFSNAPSGTVVALGGSKLQFQGNLADSGNFAPAANGVIYVTATAALHAGAQFTGAGVSELVGIITLDGQVSSSGNLQLGDPASSLPVLTTTGLLEVSGGGTLTWLGGTLQSGTNGTGTVQIDSGGTMLINQLNYLGIRGIILTNNGTVNCTNQGTVFIGYNAEIDNVGAFNLWNDGGLYLFASGTTNYNVATFNNYGTLEKQLGATNYYSIIAIPVNSGVATNGGIIKADQGATLQLNAGGSIGILKGQGQIKLAGGTFVASPNAATVGSYVAPNILLNGSAVLNLASDLTLMGGTFELDPGGTITGPGNFMATYGNFVWAGGTINLPGPGVFRAGPSCTVTITGGGNVKRLYHGTFINSGTLNWRNDNSAGGLWAYDGAVFINNNSWNCFCDAGIFDYSTNTPPVFTNGVNGVISKNSVAYTGTSNFGLRFVNQGTVQVGSGTVEILTYDDSGPDPNSAQVLLRYNGRLVVDTVVVFHGTISGSGQLTGNHGETIVGALNADQIQLGSDLTNGGKVTAGDAPGIISYLAGNNYYQTTNGTLIIPIRGTNALTPDFGQLKLNTLYGQANLAGTLEADIIEGYAPPVGASFPCIVSSQRNGTFNHVILPPGMQLNYTPGGVTLVVTGTVPVQIISPAVTNGQFQFGFNTISNRSYTVQYKDNLASGNWIFLTNFIGTGAYWQPPPLSPLVAQRFFRVSNP